MENRESIRQDLYNRTPPRVVELPSLFKCPKKDYIGKFPQKRDYEDIIKEDCDVYVSGKKVLSFRKSLLPFLKEGSTKQPKLWEFFRKASREVYGTQRGVVAGTEFTTRTEARLTKGQVAFLAQSSSGLITSLEQAREAIESSDEFTTKTIKTRRLEKSFPQVKADLLEISRLSKESPHLDFSEKKRQAVWQWFEPWLVNEWLPSKDKVSLTKKLIDDFVSSQLNFNHCYSNVLGPIDRGARFPYGRLSGTTIRNYDSFVEYKDIYSSACEGFKHCFPESWEYVKGVIAKAKDPVYSLFDTAFTSITLNFNFKTAYHTDKNNLSNSLAVLTVITKGSYDGHFLVFPELRLAFDLRDGDFIVGDTQTLLHGNTEMEKLSDDAERISLVFYSRENIPLLDDLECESCRRDFMRFSADGLKDKSKTHGQWRGVWPGMWASPEWLEFRKNRGLERCSNSNWQLSSPYTNKETGETKLFKHDPGPLWEHVEVM